PGRAFHPIVLENGSRPDEAGLLEAGLPGSATLLASDANLGFAAGVNAAAAYGSADWILLLNPDLVPGEGVLGSLLSRLPAAPAHGILGAVRLGDGPRSYGEFPGLLDRFRAPSRVSSTGAPQQVDWVSGCFMAIRRSLFASLGGFDEGFFMQLEDVDLCWRALGAGFVTLVDPRLTFEHPGHLSYVRSGRDLGRDYHHARTRLLTRHRGRVVGWAYRILSGLSAMARTPRRGP
ncbi:MAG: glycosyltransferase family 2 protein, partial [Candidatus Riflebacteria bacterium]|nr:glycosyltransferase family 2 protein [Candidatus Riflebacteria bacterium]